MCNETEMSNDAATNKGAKSDIPKPPLPIQIPPEALVPPPRELWNPPECSWTLLVRDPTRALTEFPLSDLSA
jgi:hypothetical protein